MRSHAGCQKSTAETILSHSLEDDVFWRRFGPAIVRNLDDDEPRLRVAQSLEANRPESRRARLIRVQVKLASFDGGMDHPEWFRTAVEARRLVADSKGEWLPDVIRRLEPTDVVFHRGFAESIVVEVRQLTRVDVVARLSEFTVLRHLTLCGVNPPIDFPLLYSSVFLNASRPRRMPPRSAMFSPSVASPFT